MISPEILRRYGFFSGFSPRELKELAMIARDRNLERGEYLFAEGDRADDFYFLVEGEMETLIRTDDEEVPLSTIPPGDPVGWSALIEPHLYTASARATRVCRVLAFARTELGRALEDPHFTALLMRKIAEVVSRRLRDSQIQLLSLTAKRA